MIWGYHYFWKYPYIHSPVSPLSSNSGPASKTRSSAKVQAAFAKCRGVNSTESDLEIHGMKPAHRKRRPFQNAYVFCPPMIFMKHFCKDAHNFGGIFWGSHKNHPNISKSFKRNLFQFRTAAMRSLLPSCESPRLLEPIRELIRHRVFHEDTGTPIPVRPLFFLPPDS